MSCMFCYALLRMPFKVNPQSTFFFWQSVCLLGSVDCKIVFECGLSKNTETITVTKRGTINE